MIWVLIHLSGLEHWYMDDSLVEHSLTSQDMPRSDDQ
jgi:hypothetical protein